MRWLVGWSSTAAVAAKYATGPAGYAADGVGNGTGVGAGYAAGATGYDGETVHPVGSQLLWGDPIRSGRSATGVPTRSASCGPTNRRA